MGIVVSSLNSKLRHTIKIYSLDSVYTVKVHVVLINRRSLKISFLDPHNSRQKHDLKDFAQPSFEYVIKPDFDQTF